MVEQKDVLCSAKELYRQAKFADEIALLEEALNSPSPDSDSDQQALLYTELSRAMRTLGDYAECEKFVEKALLLAKSQEVLIEVWNEQGQLLDPMNKHHEAVAVLQKAVELARSCLPTPSALTGEVLVSLSLALVRLGEIRDAIIAAQEGGQLLQQTLGEKHEKYASALEHLGLAQLHAGLISEPEVLHRKSLEIRTEYFGPDHPEIAFSLMNLGGTLQAGGKLDGVEEMMKSAVDIYTRHYGESSITTAMAVNNLGGVYLDQLNFGAAAVQYERALAMKERILGKDNPGLRLNLRNLAVAYEQSGRKEEAKQYRNRADKLREQTPTAQTDLDIMIQTAVDLIATNKRKQAVPLMTEALSISERQHGEGPKTAIVLKYLASALTEDDPELAKMHAIRSFRITKSTFGKTHPRVAEVLHVLGSCYLLQGDNGTYNLIMQQADYIESLSGQPSGQDKLLAIMMGRGDKDSNPKYLASMLRTMGKEDEANAIINEYIRSKEETGSPDIAFAKELLKFGMEATISTSKEQAIEWLQKAASILDTLPDAQADGIKAHRTLSDAFAELGRFDEARTSIKRALQLHEEKDGALHWSLKDELTRLKDIEEKSGNEEELERVKLLIESLPEPDPVEEQDRLQVELDELMSGFMSSMTEMLSSLGAEADVEADGVLSDSNESV